MPQLAAYTFDDPNTFMVSDPELNLWLRMHASTANPAELRWISSNGKQGSVYGLYGSFDTRIDPLHRMAMEVFLQEVVWPERDRLAGQFAYQDSRSLLY